MVPRCNRGYIEVAFWLAKAQRKLVLLQLAVDGAHGTAAGRLVAGGLKGFVYGYGIDLLHRNLRIYNLLLHFCAESFIIVP